MSELATTTQTQWQHLAPRTNTRWQQLFIKGTRIRASVIYSDMLVNQDTPEETADNWDLPLSAIHEVMEYCQTHQALLKQEAEAERQFLREQGVSLEP